jgi:predicted nucleic acid-binding protein
MDAYLAAMARLHGIRLVSFDHGFRKFDGLDWIELAMPK